MENNSDSLEIRIKSLEDLVNNLRELVLTVSKHNIHSFNTVDSNFENLKQQVEILDGRVQTLQKAAKDGFNGVGEQIDDLKSEVMKIEKVSNYTEEYKNLLSITK